jgi:AraC-like DNA-binding protein
MKKQRESIKVFSLPFFSGAEAIIGQHVINEFRRHIHKTYIIGIVEQGRRIITHSDGSAQVSENEIFVLNPSQVHSCNSKSQSGHSYKVLSISSQTMQSIASQISEKPEKRPFFKNVRYENDVLSDRIIRLFDLIEDPESDIQIESNLYSFLTYLIMSFSESPPLISATGEQTDSIKRVCDYIGQNYMENLSLKKLAEVACLSPFHFQREFKKSIGITPHEYLSDIRIRESKMLLLNSEDIADIAIQLGFFDQSHFSKIFKKTVGVPPGKYSKINRTR